MRVGVIRYVVSVSVSVSEANEALFFLSLHFSPEIPLIIPISTLNHTPTPTMNRHRPLAIPSSRMSQPALPRGQTKPVMTPRIMTSTRATRPTSSLSVPLPPPLLRALVLGLGLVGLLLLSSIHPSSMRRKLSGEGSVSGVYRGAWMLRNCRRSWFTSAGVKPAERRRSKPRGVAEVLGVLGGSGEGRRGEVASPPTWDPVVVVVVDVARGGGREAAVASASSSDEVRLSPMEQFT